MRILVVEDEPRLRQLLERGLREEGHAVGCCTSLAEARARVALREDDLLVLDRGLPDGDGLELVRHMRRGGDARPVLVLSAKDRVEERVTGLHEGADDYLGKPFSFDELLARIGALARRGGLGAGRIRVDDLEVDLDALRVYRGGAEIDLTGQEFRLLRYFAENVGRVLTRTRLLEHVWDIHHDPGTNVVDVYVGYLRAKIDKGHGRPLLHTVRGRGYVLESRPGEAG